MARILLRPQGMLVDRLLDLLWPRRCAACDAPEVDVGASHGLLCVPCAVTLYPTSEDCCPRCGLDALDPPSLSGHLCGDCLERPPPYALARAAFHYGGALTEALARYKNAPESTLAEPLGRLMAERWRALAAQDWPDAPLVVPVPSHPKRLRKRGFNPAGALARMLCARAGLPAPTGAALRATRLIPAAHSASRAARRARVAGVFEGDRRRLEGREVLLVDDVITTGATVAAASRACRAAGARRVTVLALARVPL